MRARSTVLAGISLLAAFRFRMFTILWIATIVSNIGGWMYSAAAGWLMTGLTKDAFVVSLVQVASSAPFFLLALVAGALSDVVDKRRLLIWGESATALLSAIFAALVWLKLGHAGFAALVSVLHQRFGSTNLAGMAGGRPSLVPKEELPSAVSANSVGFNLSRAVGPALAGAIIGPLGIAAPFVINAVSNFGVIGVLLDGANRRRRRTLCLRSALAAQSESACDMRSTISLCAEPSFERLRSSCPRVPTGAAPACRSPAREWGRGDLWPLARCDRARGCGAAFVMPYWKKRLGADGLVAMASVGTALALVLFGSLASRSWP